VLLYNNLRNSKACIQNKWRSRWYEADEDTVGTVSRLRNYTMTVVSIFLMVTVQRQGREGGHIHVATRLRTSGATHLLALYVCLHNIHGEMFSFLARNGHADFENPEWGEVLNQDQCRCLHIPDRYRNLL
jgi:hypothetical protein